jgi:hypothetical protein
VNFAASHRAVRELQANGLLPADTKLRSSKYLNNLIEQDHLSIKQRIAAMRGFKNFRHAAITIAGIELMQPIRQRRSGWYVCRSPMRLSAPRRPHALIGASFRHAMRTGSSPRSRRRGSNGNLGSASTPSRNMPDDPHPLYAAAWPWS